MAQYTIRYACGHEETISLYGPHKEREAKIAYLQEHGKCHACYQAEARAKAQARASEFPTLNGSEKQISWAMDIRQKWIEKVDEFFAQKGSSWAELKAKFDGMPQETQQKMLAAPLTNPLALCLHVLTETEAKFFIDNRNI